MHELRRTQSPLDQTCIPIVFDQSLRKTCPPSHLPPATTSGSCFPFGSGGPAPLHSLQVPRISTSQLQSHFLQPIHPPSLSSNSAVGLSLRLIYFMSSCIPTPSSRALFHITLSILCVLGVAAGRPTQNITIEVPKGTTTHGDSFCTPPTWVDIASFLLFNYIAHGATVVSYPGERSYFTAIIVLVTIFSPKIGVKRALNLIIRHPRSSIKVKDDLKVALRSGALCMLVRSPNWKPKMGDNIKNALQDRNTSHLGHSANKVLPTYVPIYSYSRPIKQTHESIFPYTKALPPCRSTRRHGSMIGHVFGLTRTLALSRLGIERSSVSENHLNNTNLPLSREIQRLWGLKSLLQPNRRIPLRNFHHHST